MTYSYNVNLSMILFSGFQRFNNLKIQYITYEITKQSHINLLSNLIYELKQDYLETVYQQQLLVLTENILKRRQQNYELVKLKYEAGSEDIGSLLRVEADLNQAEYEYKKTKRNYETILDNLLVKIGIQKSGIILDKNFLEVEYKTIEKYISLSTNVIRQNPEFLIKNYEIEKSKLESKISKSNLYPNISASVNYNISDTKPLPDINKWSLSWQIRANYNIFKGFKDITDLKIANLNVKTAEFDRQTTENNLIMTLHTLKNNLIDTKELLDVKNKYLLALEKQAEIVSLKYANGLTNYYDWYQIEDSYINMQKSVLISKKEIKYQEILFEKFLAITD